MLLHGSCTAFRPVYCTGGCSLCAYKIDNEFCTKMKKLCCCGRCFAVAVNISRKDEKAFKRFLLRYFKTENTSNPVRRRPLSIATTRESSTTLTNRPRRQPSVDRLSASSTQVHPASPASSTAGIKYAAAHACAMHTYFTSHCIYPACVQPLFPLVGTSICPGHPLPPCPPPSPSPFYCTAPPSPLHYTLFSCELSSLLNYRNQCTNALHNDRRRLFLEMYATGTKVCCSTSRGWVPGTVSSVQSHATAVSLKTKDAAASSLHTLIAFRDYRSKLACTTPDDNPTHATLQVREPNMS
jgi:hypothetical protein